MKRFLLQMLMIWVYIYGFIYFVFREIHKSLKYFLSLMSPEAKLILVFLVSYAVSKLWTLLPESDITYNNLIIYRNVIISKRSHWSFIWGIISNAIIVASFLIVTKKYRWAITLLFILYILDLPDYWLIFGEAIFFIKKYPIEYGLIKGIFMVCIFTAIFINEFCVARND